MKRYLLMLLIVISLSVVLGEQPQQASPQTLYVDNVEDCNGSLPCYSTIASALNAAEPADTIQVFPSVYHETVIFEPAKQNIALLARFAAQPPVIVAPNSGSSAVVIKASNVTLRNLVLEADGNVVDVPNFTPRVEIVIEDNQIRGSGQGIGNGIYAANVSYLTLRGNTIRRVIGAGIQLGAGQFEVSESLIDANVIVDTAGPGILLAAGRETTIKRNIIRATGGDGILLSGERPQNNLVELNTVTGNSRDGIRCIATPFVHGNLFRKNTAVENGGCDINDLSISANTWKNNRARIKCGSAVD